MSRHSFDPEIAGLVGMNAAVIFQNIAFWCERNAIKGRNVYEDNAWTFNSIANFESLFPYLSGKQIRTALEKLEESGLLESGNFNADQRDRTKWYALTKGSDAFARMVKSHLTSGAETFAREGEPLPDSKPDSKQQMENTRDARPAPDGASDLFSANGDPVEEKTEPDRFDEFWKVYPKKSAKPEARRAWAKAIKRAPAQTIIDGARRYAHWLANPAKGEFRPTTKHPQGWLNADRWDDEEIRHVRLPDEVSDEDRRRRFAPQWGEVVR